MSSSVITPIITIVGILALHGFYERRRQKRAINDLIEKRNAERKGRIRAEQRLRELIKKVESLESEGDQEGFLETSTQKMEKIDDNKRQDIVGIMHDVSHRKKTSSTLYNMTLKCIGTVVSPFTKRMGTPRQGALAPHSRGFIDLGIPMETLQGIEEYSHAWIIFQFHANTDLQGSCKTKVRPPRANGERIGQMSTRSPHRPNALGLSLVKVDGVDYKKKRFYISALDLVNGTPVYDIKPVVPWDIPGHFDHIPLVVPDWVRHDDTLTNVSLSNDAEVMLEDSVLQGKLAPLYTRENEGSTSAKEAIKEVLAQDPRARKKRGKIDSGDESCYNIVFCSIQIEFKATSEDTIEVCRISDFKTADTDIVDGIPLYMDRSNKTTTINS